MEDDIANRLELADPPDPDAEVEALRSALLDAEFDLAQAKTRTVLVLINGPDGSGKGEVLNRLCEWLDPKSVDVLAYDLTDAEENRRPANWRYWRDLPRRGRIGLIVGSWYHLILRARALREIDREGFARSLRAITEFETMLDREGVLVVKIWLALAPEISAKRLRQKRAQAQGPGRTLVCEWGAVDRKKERQRLADAMGDLVEASAETPQPWTVIDAADRHQRDLVVGRTLLAALRSPLPAKPRLTKPPAKPRRITSGPSALSWLDMTQTADKAGHDAALETAQNRLFDLTQGKAFRKRGLVCAFEGNDAAGKGGTIRRLRAALDPREAFVHGISAPTEDELAHPYLWRFWRRIPDRGQTVIFDRSWYGRVLVERVEGFAASDDWRRAYAEINQFERYLTTSGYIVQKFWLAIDPDEQLRRFEARAATQHKRFKITEDDWRNREKAPAYAVAVEDMLALTATEGAPWTLVAANDKRFARLKVLETLVDRLEKELGYSAGSTAKAAPVA
jgi:polyphosphate:AMP phosphotransferase